MSPESRHQIGRAATTAGETARPDSASPAPHRFVHDETDPNVVARLEWLDDLIFAAINGDPAALESAADAWKKMLDELGSDALEESRRQYLRHAQSVWNDLRSQSNHPPHKIFAAIEIISLLAEKAW